MTPWATATKRGIVPIVLGILCLLASIPAIEDLDPLLKGLGAILVVRGVALASWRARPLMFEGKRVGPRV